MHDAKMILLFGDIHGDFRHVLPAVAEHRPAAIILLGDIEANRPLEKELSEVMKLTEVWWIPGNHDTDTVENWRNLFQSQLSERNLHGRIVEIAGVRVAGLGGVFRGEVWYPDQPEAPVHYASYDDYRKRSEPGRIITARQARSHGKTNRADDASALARPDGLTSGKLLTHRSTIFYKDWFELYGRRADILVTHEAPGCHPHGFQVLTELARSMRVKFSFHGHQHDCLNYSAKFAAMEHQAYGVGFRAITDMYGGQILHGGFDEARRYREDKPDRLDLPAV